MKEYNYKTFTGNNDIINLLNKILNSHESFPSYMDSSDIAIMIEGLKENTLKIYEYDFFNYKDIYWSTIINLDTTITDICFKGKQGYAITNLRKKAVSILGNKTITNCGNVILDDKFNLFESNSIYIKSRNAIAICGSKDSSRFFDIITCAKDITNEFFVFPYSYNYREDLFTEKELFYRIVIDEKFIELYENRLKEEMKKHSKIMSELYDTFNV